MIDPNDPCEARAHELVAALHERGVACRLHWDRSPWGAQIYLTDHHDEHAPSLFMLTEGEQDNVGGKYRAFVWRGQLGNFEPEMYDPIIQMVERPWLGHGVAEIADELAPLVKLLRTGALAHNAHAVVARARFRARFVPQAWVNDNAIDIDPAGEQEWDATAGVTAMDEDYRSALVAEIMEHGEALDGDDWLKGDPNAPEWVREHQGPFSIWLRPGRPDDAALDEIAHMLRDPDWGVGMLEDIAEIVAGTGRSLENPDATPTWDRH